MAGFDYGRIWANLNVPDSITDGRNVFCPLNKVIKYYMHRSTSLFLSQYFFSD